MYTTYKVCKPEYVTRRVSKRGFRGLYDSVLGSRRWTREDTSLQRFLYVRNLIVLCRHRYIHYAYSVIFVRILKVFQSPIVYAVTNKGMHSKGRLSFKETTVFQKPQSLVLYKIYTIRYPKQTTWYYRRKRCYLIGHIIVSIHLFGGK